MTGVIAGLAAALSQIWRPSREDQTPPEEWRDLQTGLPRYALLLDRIDLALKQAKRKSQGFALLLIDAPMDQHGEARQQHFALLADRVRKALRESDTLGINLSEQLVALLPQVGADNLSPPLQRIFGGLTSPSQVGDRISETSPHAGVAFYPGSADTSETLLAHAQAALQHAKSGVQRYCIFSGA